VTDPDWVSVFRSPGRQACNERALVLGAMGIEFLVAEQPDGCHVFVHAGDAARAVEEIARYQLENPPRARPLPAGPPAVQGLGAAAAFAAVLTLAWLTQVTYAGGIDWLTAGEAVAGRIAGGEWWRACTALLLHADPGHYVANAVFGAFFAYLLGQYAGSGLACLTVLVAGAVGNGVNAWAQLPDHRSIGASTAVFAALGAVAAQAWRVDRRTARNWAYRAAPLVVGVGLLAWLGTGDAQTDVAAHLAGFLAGVVAGFGIRAVPAAASHPVLQRAATLLGAGLLLLAWAEALWSRPGP
jgi:rhomboid protease GluP